MAIEVDIEEVLPVVDMDFALTDDSPLVHPGWHSYETVGGDFPRGGNVCAEMSSDPGGVTEVFATADRIIEDEYRSHRQYQAYLEPKGAVAIYEGGRYTVHIAHQYPFRVRDRLAEVLGVSSSDVRIVGHHIGGAFGAKLDISLEPYAALLARATGRPVKIVYKRSEDLITCQCREDAIFRVRSAVASDGRILGREIDVLINAGAPVPMAPISLLSPSSSPGPRTGLDPLEYGADPSIPIRRRPAPTAGSAGLMSSSLSNATPITSLKVSTSIAESSA